MSHRSSGRDDESLPPEIDADVTGRELSREVTGRLRTLSKETAGNVARHLVMTYRHLNDDPDLAYAHARAAAGRGSRVDVVREALGLAAYVQGNYGEALRELRTARRLSGGPGIVSVLADCERGLGRPERAIALAEETDMRELDRTEIIELGIVVAGARMDLEQPEAALVFLDRLRPATTVERERVEAMRADVLEALGRSADAQAARARAERLGAEIATAIAPESDGIADTADITDLEEE